MNFAKFGLEHALFLACKLIFLSSLTPNLSYITYTHESSEISRKLTNCGVKYEELMYKYIDYRTYSFMVLRKVKMVEE